MSDDPQHAFSYIYLIQDGNYKGTTVYKVGKTTTTDNDIRNLSRLKAYSYGSIIYLISNVHCDDINVVEIKIKNLFKDKYILASGSEWFDGNVRTMKSDIHAIIEEFAEKREAMTTSQPEILTCSKCNIVFNNKTLMYRHMKLCSRIEYVSIYDKIISRANYICSTVHYENVPNNIFCNFKEENLEYITPVFANICFQYIFHDYGVFDDGLRSMIKNIYFNPEHVENHNIRYITRKNVSIYENNSWVTKPLNDVISYMIIVAKYSIVKNAYHDICNKDRDDKSEVYKKIQSLQKIDTDAMNPIKALVISSLLKRSRTNVHK